MTLLAAGCSRSHDPSTDQTPRIQSDHYARLTEWQTVDATAMPFASLTQHSFADEGGDFDPDSSANARWLVFSSLRHAFNPDLYIKQINGTTATRLTSDPASEIQPSFSPSADKVAYASNRSGSWDIWVIGVDGSNPTRLTDGTSHDIHPSWSPDGRYIVYCSFGPRSTQWELWMVDVDSPSTRRWIGYGMFPVWSPNPSIPKIAFQQSRMRGGRWFSIWTVDFENGEARYPTEIVSHTHFACICPAWSPDGRRLAYSTATRVYGNQPGEQQQPNTTQQQHDDQATNSKQGLTQSLSGEDIWVVDLDGRNNQRLTQSDTADYAPHWLSDSQLLFCSNRRGVDNIWSMKPQQVNLTAKTGADLAGHPQNRIVAN